MQKQHYVTVLFNEPQPVGRRDQDGKILDVSWVEYVEAGFTFDDNDRLHIFRRGVGTIASVHGDVVKAVLTEEAGS